MDVSTPPSLDLACPQAKAEIDKHDHMLRERGIDKNKIRTWSIMIFIITATYHHKTSLERVIIRSQVKV